MHVQSKMNNWCRIQIGCVVIVLIFALIPTSMSSLDVSYDHARVSPSSIAHFTITITNSGETPLDPVRVVDTLPAGISYISDDKGGFAKGQNITWSNIGHLDVGESIPVHLVTRIAPRVLGELENLVTVTGTPPTGYDVTDRDTEDIYVEAPWTRENRGDSVEVGHQKAIATNPLGQDGVRNSATAKNYNDIMKVQSNRGDIDGGSNHMGVRTGDQLALAHDSGSAISKISIKSVQD